MEKYDVVIVGSGIGGLCCGSILALSGKKVLICEAHSQPGGVAHSFKKNGYTFESGPSLWSGIGKWPTTNPLGQILKLLDEEVELFQYKGWQVIVPEGNFNLDVGEEPFKHTNESLFLMCAKKIFFWKYIEIKKTFWRDFLTKNIFYEVILGFDS